MTRKNLLVRANVRATIDFTCARCSLSRAIVDAILEQSRAEYPDECCGVILGPAGADTPIRHLPMINAAHSPTFYEFDPKDLLALYREVDDKDEELIFFITPRIVEGSFDDAAMKATL
jgi:hypothetical protein